MVRLILIALLLLSVSPADAQRWRDRDHGRRDFHHDRRDRHRDSGIGGFIGGVIGGIIRGQESDPVGECARRFRSYNPETGFYRGFDGYLRRCP